MTERHVALTIAGSDSGGGAGIQADLKTFHAFGVFGTSAITAITAQNTVGVRSIQKIEPDVVADQIRAVADDLKPAAAKTGMLADAPIIEAVASTIRETGLGQLVVDPVMVAKSGDRLLEQDAVNALATQLLPLSEVLTPNLPEAAILAGRRVETPDDMRAAAEVLAQRGARSVLVKGGHLSGDVLIDLFFDGVDWHEWQETRQETRHTHGTGCTLSAAICAGLALGWPRVEAVEKARLYTQRAIATAPELGKGHGPLNHWVAVGNSGFGDSGIR
jgi:hydroxymethylpyrimidine/phosphomethylpyrimidine kinase